MSEDNSPSKSGAWTTEAKYEFLMNVIAVTNENKPIPWAKIKIPGRTTKSLQNMWTKINKDLTEMKNASDDGDTATPRKRGPNKKTGDETITPPKSAKKRAAPVSRGPSKKPKKEEPEEDVKDESGSEDTIKPEED